MDPAARLERLCYGGEELLESTSLEAGAIGITSHRVLVLTPDGSGARFRALDRPNVTGIVARPTGPTSRRNWSVVVGAVGVGLLVAGLAIDEVLRFAGLFALLVALGLLAWYYWASGWVIEVAVAGADAVRIPIARDEIEAGDHLDEVLEDVRGADDARVGFGGSGLNRDEAGPSGCRASRRRSPP